MYHLLCRASMKETIIVARYFFSSDGQLPWDILGGCEEEWQLTEKQIKPFGKTKDVQVWKNTAFQDKEYKD